MWCDGLLKKKEGRKQERGEGGGGEVDSPGSWLPATALGRLGAGDLLHFVRYVYVRYEWGGRSS